MVASCQVSELIRIQPRGLWNLLREALFWILCLTFLLLMRARLEFCSHGTQSLLMEFVPLKRAKVPCIRGGGGGGGPEFRSSFLWGIPMTSIIVYWDLYRGLLIVETTKYGIGYLT